MKHLLIALMLVVTASAIVGCKAHVDDDDAAIKVG